MTVRFLKDMLGRIAERVVPSWTATGARDFTQRTPNDRGFMLGSSVGARRSFGLSSRQVLDL